MMIIHLHQVSPRKDSPCASAPQAAIRRLMSGLRFLQLIHGYLYRSVALAVGRNPPGGRHRECVVC